MDADETVSRISFQSTEYWEGLLEGSFINFL